jgi:nucleoside 2-deoxyribosyltransferase
MIFKNQKGGDEKMEKWNLKEKNSIIRKRQGKKKFYIAGPLKFESTRMYLDQIENLVLELDFNTWTPYKDAGILTNKDLKNPEKVKKVLEQDIVAFQECDGAIFLLDGYHTGTIFELGYAYYFARNIRPEFILIGIYTTIRGQETLDSMVRFAFQDVKRGYLVTSLQELKKILLLL